MGTRVQPDRRIVQLFAPSGTLRPAMIAFRCVKCRKPFTVPDSYAGKRARCKGCDTQITVPAGSDPELASPTPAAPARPPLRVRRLISDHEAMQQMFGKSPHIKI